MSTYHGCPQYIMDGCNIPTDAHKGLPYYMTGEGASRIHHVVYSRVAPCGRPCDCKRKASVSPITSVLESIGRNSYVH